MNFHVTGEEEPEHAIAPQRNSLNNGITEVMHIACNYEYVKGRPKLFNYLSQLQKLYMTVDRLCVMVCGPQDMENEIAIICSKLSINGMPDLDYSSQSYIM